jgi:hypothetical protein
VPSTDLAALTALIREFSEAREWEQFHTPKNLAMALAVEAAELMEHFQWLTPEEAARLGDDPRPWRTFRRDGRRGDLPPPDGRRHGRGPGLGRAPQGGGENDRRFPVDRIRGRATLPPTTTPRSRSG